MKDCYSKQKRLTIVNSQFQTWSLSGKHDSILDLHNQCILVLTIGWLSNDTSLVLFTRKQIHMCWETVLETTKCHEAENSTLLMGLELTTPQSHAEHTDCCFLPIYKVPVWFLSRVMCVWCFENNTGALREIIRDVSMHSTRWHYDVGTQ